VPGSARGSGRIEFKRNEGGRFLNLLRGEEEGAENTFYSRVSEKSLGKSQSLSTDGVTVVTPASEGRPLDEHTTCCKDDNRLGLKKQTEGCPYTLGGRPEIKQRLRRGGQETSIFREVIFTRGGGESPWK